MSYEDLLRACESLKDHIMVHLFHPLKSTYNPLTGFFIAKDLDPAYAKRYSIAQVLSVDKIRIYPVRWKFANAQAALKAGRKRFGNVFL